MTKEMIKNIADKIGISSKQFMQDCLDGAIFVFNTDTLHEFWLEAELEELGMPYLVWVEHEINSKYLFTIDNKFFFMIT